MPKPCHTALRPGLACLCLTAALALGCAPTDALAQTRAAEADRPPTISPRATDNPYDYFDGLRYNPDVPTPESVLGYPIGRSFTRHADMLGYLATLAEASDRVRMEQYGVSHQRRPLHILTISSPANLTRLDEILARNRELADPGGVDAARVRSTIENNPSIVWLSYNVHGNEPSPSETAMQVAYTLAASTNTEVRDILEKLVIVLDPCINPDGRERYVGWLDQTMGRAPDPTPESAEHDEPWPQGRTNHYLFDLNRDWLWGVHPESRSRVEIYRKYLPHLHVDYHEMGASSPYFFGAGDDPYNVNIPDETREWIDLYGDANAKVFDEHGLVYATRERFDYLYPGYGKVLPVYHGAVGLLTEKAGHGRAGVAIEVRDGYVLTLTERVRDHYLTSMNYLETSAKHRRAQNERFHRFFQESLRLSQDAGPSSFIIHADNDPALLRKVWDLCMLHGVRIHRLRDDTTLRDLRPYRGESEPVEARYPAGSWIITVDQPMGRLVRAIFERETELTTTETYDITGWSVPVFFGLDAHYANHIVDAPMTRLDSWSPPTARVTGEGDYALLVDASQHRFPRALALAREHELFCRRTGGEIEIQDQRFAPRSLIVHTVRNLQRDLDAFIRDCLDAGVSVHRVATGMTEDGHVLGANDNWHLTTPRVLLLRGSPLSNLSYGQHWHLLDVESPLPYSAVNIDAFGRVNLDNYSVIVLADVWGDGGSLGRALGERNIDRIKDWVRGGGVIVATGGSAMWASRAILDLDVRADAEADDRPKLSELTYEERRQRRVEDNIPGAVLSASLDMTHPLSTGMREWVGVLKRNARTLPLGDNGYVVARFDEAPRVGGYISDRNQERMAGRPHVTHHQLGRGHVICFSDDTTTRGFMHAPMRLLLNAITLGPSL